MEIVIGTKVKINDNTSEEVMRRTWLGQSNGDIGEVVATETHNNSDGIWHKVKWSHGHTNGYPERDLIILKPNKIKWL